MSRRRQRHGWRVGAGGCVTRGLITGTRATGVRWTDGLLAVALLGAAASTGCTHIGPGTVAVDRFDYSTAIADSWKKQTLLNIVKLRYVDLPVFVDVASIVSGYSLQTGVSAVGVLSSLRFRR
jgi:hypothetical protein